MPATVGGQPMVPCPDAVLAERQSALVFKRHQEVEERNARYFNEEENKLENWSEDLKLALDRELKDIGQSIKEAKRASLAAVTLQDKLNYQKQVKELVQAQKKKRAEIFESQDAIEARRDALIEKLQSQLEMNQAIAPLFTVRWTVR
jgi:hypothetical protein